MSKCPDCFRKLKPDQAKCACGWKPFTAPASIHKSIQCVYADCIEGALARVWTKTGWANVCVTHYPKIEIVPRPKSDNPHIEAIRKEMARAMRRKEIARNLRTLEQQIPFPKEPGEDEQEAA